MKLIMNILGEKPVKKWMKYYIHLIAPVVI